MSDNIAKNSTPVMLRTTSVEPNRNQPRKTFDENALRELADSIGRLGILQPIAVERADGYYRIVAGERRWRAAMMIHLKEIPAIILNLTEREAAEASIIENEQREDLNPIERALAYRNYCQKYHSTHEELANRLSKNRVTITNALRLLTLPEKVQAMLRDGAISSGHGIALTTTKDPAEQERMAERIVREKLSVRDVEDELRKKPKKKTRANAPSGSYNPEWIGKELTERTGWKVTVSGNAGKGSVKIDFYDEDMLDEIYEFLLQKRQS